MKRFLKWTAPLLMAAALAVPASAIFGFGAIVFDPSNYQQAVQQLIQLEQQYEQLVRTYQQIRAQYDHMLRMAQQVPVNMATRYKAVATPWRHTGATNTYGTTSGWISSINTGLNVQAGYARATQALTPYEGALGEIPGDQLDRVKTSYGTVELADGANLHGLETVGRLRANSAAVENAILALELDSLSSAPEMNTQVAVLNKINAASIIALRNGQDANKLLVALAEQRLIEAKRQRDAEAQAINNHVRFMAEGRRAIQSQAADASAAMRAWKMP